MEHKFMWVTILSIEHLQIAIKQGQARVWW